MECEHCGDEYEAGTECERCANYEHPDDRYERYVAACDARYDEWRDEGGRFKVAE